MWLVHAVLLHHMVLAKAAIIWGSNWAGALAGTTARLGTARHLFAIWPLHVMSPWSHQQGEIQQGSWIPITRLGLPKMQVGSCQSFFSLRPGPAQYYCHCILLFKVSHISARFAMGGGYRTLGGPFHWELSLKTQIPYQMGRVKQRS